MIYDIKKVINKFPAGLFNTQIYTLVWAAFADFLSLCWFAIGMIWRKMVQNLTTYFHTFQIIIIVFVKYHINLSSVGDHSYGIFMNFGHLFQRYILFLRTLSSKELIQGLDWVVWVTLCPFVTVFHCSLTTLGDFSASNICWKY